ncbi:MAG TPA: LCP family protein [Desulfobacteria bacterium]|nr:LCP family protein [Desulfobacteria bacterium]
MARVWGGVARLLKRARTTWKQLPVWQKIMVVIAALLVLALVGGAIAYAIMMHKPRKIASIDPKTGQVVITDEQPLNLNDRVSILLVGVDERKNAQDHSYRTDTMILASIDPKYKQISLLSIPRDTRVNIPNHGLDKINAAAQYGGLNTTVAIVSNLTGVKIDGYVKTNFDGFKEIIDTLGGITVDVEKDMYYETGDTEDGIINLKKGVQVLNGSQALQYTRFRHDALADISRTARQQVVLKAIAQKTMQAGSLLKIPTLIGQFYKVVDTSLPLPDLITVAKAAASYDGSKVVSQTLPGYFLTVNGVSYWGVDPDEAKKVAADLFQGTVVGNTPDKLISASAKNANSATSGNTLPTDPQPQVQIGTIYLNSMTARSISLSVSACSGVAKAEVWRWSNGGSFRVYPIGGQVWNGGAINFTDGGLRPGTRYSYAVRVYSTGGKLLQVGDFVSGTTKDETTTEPPSSQPTTPAQPQPPPTQPKPAPAKPTPDTTPPHLTVGFSPGGAEIAQNAVTVSGETEYGATIIITVNGKTEATIPGGGQFSHSVRFAAAGQYNIVVSAVDAAGNRANAAPHLVTYHPTPTTTGSTTKR